jgi:hypothetical protein
LHKDIAFRDLPQSTRVRAQAGNAIVSQNHKIA